VTFSLCGVELEISPDPDAAERRAIAAALPDRGEPPAPYLTVWRQAGINESVEPEDAS
jgi:hypothetical protein